MVFTVVDPCFSFEYGQKSSGACLNFFLEKLMKECEKNPKLSSSHRWLHKLCAILDLAQAVTAMDDFTCTPPVV